MWESVYYYREQPKGQYLFNQDVLIYGATPAGITVRAMLPKQKMNVRITFGGK